MPLPTNSNSNAENKAMKLWWERTTACLESLPAELQRNFKLMRDLDGRAQNVMQEVDHLGEEFLRLPHSPGPNEKRKELTAKITKFFNKAKEYGDDKVQLAIQTYELVDKHIRRLDSDLARFESEIKNGTTATADADSTTKSQVKRGRKREKEPASSSSSNKKQKTAEVEEKAGASKGKGGGGASPARKKHKSEIQLAAEQASSMVGSGEVLDMPVDPNEPTYCICHQVSYGEMIACDNPECPIEWFHITCMGLNSIPKGKWYCPKCQPLVPVRKK